MRLSLTVEPSENTQLPSSMQCAPPTAYWNLVPIELQ